jgi:hypothetical protein
MQSALIAAALILGAGPGEPLPSDDSAAPQAFYAEAPRPYAPSITVYYFSPNYDCYSHGHRGIECYPAFRERNYRRPYNFRVKFDYPWHEDVYRSWPDACVGDESANLYVAQTPQVYTGPRQDRALAQRPLANPQNPQAAALREPPLPR